MSRSAQRLRRRMEDLRPWLDERVARWHRPEFIVPDPLQWVRAYERVADREIAGLIAAGLAFGRVASILQSVQRVLEPMGASPAAFLDVRDAKALSRIYRGFRHRWTTEQDLVRLLLAVQALRRAHGSLGAAFRPDDCLLVNNHPDGVWPALTAWVCALRDAGAGSKNSLLPDPASGSACKRLHLYLRWMVRHDDVDPGGWTGISPAQLIVPLDVHMFRECRKLGLTRRRQANRAAALEITEAFRLIAPDDPVRYDFALTRTGIRRERNAGSL